MTTTKIAYGSETAMTWTLDSLASSTTVGREFTAVDNTSTLADDYMLRIKIVYPNSAPGSDPNVYVFLGGYTATTGYDGSPVLTGADAGYTFDAAPSGNNPPLYFARALLMVQNKTRVFTLPSVATVFGGIIPPKFGGVMLNSSGQTFSTGCSAAYVAITYTSS